MQISKSFVAYGILAIMPLMFSSNLVIGRAAVEVLQPGALAFWRWSIAFLILLIVAIPGIRRNRAEIIREGPSFVLLGFLGMVICGTMVYVSLLYTSATNATLIYTTSPVFIILLERAFRGRAFQWKEWVGVSLAIIGIIVIVTKGSWAALASLRFNPGDLGILAAAISWAIYSVIVKRPGISSLPTNVTFCVIAGCGTLLILPNLLIDSTRGIVIPGSTNAWISVAILALVSSVGAFSAYQYGVKTVGPAATGVFLYLLTPYGVGMSVIFLGERLETYHLAGIVLSMGGVILATIPERFLGRRGRQSS